jgi:LVIVD repeat
MRYLYLLLSVFLFSCDPSWRDQTQITGYAPIYISKQDAGFIGTVPSKPTVHPGKIYAWGNYLFQVEQNEGIHIIDNSNPQQAHKISFLKLAAASELAIKDGHLYANNLNDLVVFDLSDISSPRLVNRVKDAFPQISQDYPPFNGAYFECVDPSKGVVIGWEEKQIDNPKCRR